ncbi:MAG: hypothetical protein JXB29_00535 [Sedimentisphaerales bacterium]|nr:hypothetical protein [Sedimentisphaerales bacterium]
MYAIGQKVLETKVIDVVLDFCRPYFEKGGRGKLAIYTSNTISVSQVKCF